MTNNNHLRDILAQQKKNTEQLEVEIQNLENLDLAKQNASLEKEAAKLNAELHSLKQKIAELNQSNSELKSAVYSQMYGEKLAILDKSQNKMELYFASGRSGEYNRLNEFESRFKTAIEARLAYIRNNAYNISNEIDAKITLRGAELTKEINDELAAIKANIAETNSLTDEMNSGYKEFRAEEITDSQIRAIAKPNKFEQFLGLNVISKIGIGLIILGVIFAAQYTYTQIGDNARAILMFALGGIFIGAGEFVGLKKQNIFSLALIAGGVAITYIALTVSYFMFNLFSPTVAAGVCIIITAIAFALSIRHNSQVIATFSLIGGFLPIMAVEGSLNYTMTYSAMAYFVILGIFTLILSFKKKWIVTGFFGLSLNIGATVYISSFFDSANAISNKVILLSYMAVSFMIYTLVPIIGTYSKGLNFKVSDVVLIALNTFFSTLILYINFYNLDIVDFNGLIPLTFMIIYIGLALFIRYKMKTERDMYALFFITAMVFFVLIIPMHFDTVWLSMGWLLQAVGLCIYGIIAERRRFSISGFIIGGLCLLVFVLHDYVEYDNHFELKYLFVTLSGLLVTTAYAFKHIEHNGAKALKYCSTVNLWFFLLYIVGRWNTVFLSKQLPDIFHIYSFICIGVTFLLLFTLTRIKPVYDKGMRGIAHVIGWIGIGWILVVNSLNHTGHDVATALTLPVINIISIVALADMLYYYFKRSTYDLRSEWFPFILSGYFMIILTQHLTVFYKVPFAGMTITLIYAGLALAWCIFGFVKRFTFMRRFGLGLTLAVVTKLFLIDFWRLTEGYRIITYFALGLTLLGISFVYQQFMKKLEK